MAKTYLKTYVRVVNEQGTFVRTSPAKEINLPLKVRDWSYPDRNAVAMRLYYALTDAPDADDTVWSYVEYKLKPTGHDNVAYVYWGEANEFTAATFNGAATETYQQTNAIAAGLNRDPNRILVSETYRPRGMRGRNAHYVGDSSEDEVISFRSNTLPVSQGQFGEYPLYVFCKNSIWTMLVGTGGIAFSRIVPFKVREGLIGRQALANIDASIVYASRDGIRSIPAGAENLSRIVENNRGEPSILDELAETVAIGYLSDRRTGRRELWVSTAEKTYIYHLDYGVWSTATVTRRGFVENSRSLLGIDADGKIYDEVDETSFRTGQFVTAPMSFGEYDLLKRIRHLALVMNSETLTLLGAKTLYDYTAALQNITESIHEFEYEAELRAAHRRKIRRPDGDAGYYGGYGGVYGEGYGEGQTTTGGVIDTVS